MHRLSTAFILGYHGCDASVARDLLAGKPFKQSHNDYDWLGHGAYFWEANPVRGLEFAHELKLKRRRANIKRPAVIGAVIDLGLCLDLMTSAGIQMVREAHCDLSAIFKKDGRDLPHNNPNQLLRPLDCAVIEFIHNIRRNDGEKPIDSVRGVFIEGMPIYPSAGFCEKTHIQICVRNPECIKAVFRVSPKQSAGQ